MLINAFLIAFAVSWSCLFVFLLYRYLRSKFPVKVNCWFCDQFHTVPYGNKNCWDCPHCEQYNGFNEVTGDYNKPIPAQYDECLNRSEIVSSAARLSTTRTKTTGESNGLCVDCNRNQLLKIKQLAQFVPQFDAHFDDEVELYRQHLEATYKLCRFCETVLHQKLGQQDSWFRSKVLSWRLRQKQKGLSPQSKRLSWSSSSNVPLKARLLRFVSMHVAIFFSITYLKENKMFAGFEANYIPQSVIDKLEVLGEHHQLLVTIGFFSLIFAIFASGKDKLKQIDAIGSFVWLAHLFLHTPPIVAVFVNIVNLRFVQIVSSLACLVITFLSFVWNRKRLIRVHSWDNSRLNLSGSSAGSDSSSTFYGSADSVTSEWLHDRDQDDSVSVSSKLSKFRDVVQDGSVTTTTTRTAQQMDWTANGFRHCNLDNDLQAMKIGSPKKNENISGVFTCRPYKSSPGLSQINGLHRHRSIISPSRFKNRSVTQSSWVAGGYWAKSNGTKFSAMNIGENSFGAKSETSHSCPVSRAGSVFCEDRLSVLSEPATIGRWSNMNCVGFEGFRESASPSIDHNGSNSTCSTASEVSVGTGVTSAPAITTDFTTSTSPPLPQITFWRSLFFRWFLGLSLISFGILLIAIYA